MGLISGYNAFSPVRASDKSPFERALELERKHVKVNLRSFVQHMNSVEHRSIDDELCECGLPRRRCSCGAASQAFAPGLGHWVRGAPVRGTRRTRNRGEEYRIVHAGWNLR
jgi:hypothetical protein